ncbi:RCC1/BLIP-II protein [Hyphopichia burtonii NRRL Y-1933]|uniref:RCC1/BLIP-II protein n=1 Tax=Hyphopichia burtonii NRRL Y-1933 TaxID=984485 RepID=A0A1E4RS58_9ASCO|nr:RCC1/BLIP-II protein [Hyphopichia burtonii NRRL Y-1933]ODV70112.1 RCC1/BLIP-II protein [Hyphopichia burtonii NRRL Y-1933]
MIRQCIARRLTARLARPVPVNYIGGRFYSDKKDSNDIKYRSIEDFNKMKKEYLFGDIDEDVANQTSRDIHDKIKEKKEPEIEEDEDNIKSIIEKDPRLLKFKPGSPDYKYELSKLHDEFQVELAKYEKQQERRERIKALATGIALLVGIITTHQLIMNYEFLSKWIKNKFSYRDVNESKVKDLTDPSKNRKNIDYMITKLLEEFEKNPDIINNLADSNKQSGLYIFGDYNKLKLPIRIPFFNDILIKQVVISKNYIVVIDESGKVYHLTSDSESKLMKLPPIEKAHIANELIYYLNNKGEILYGPRLDKQNDFKGINKRNWLGINKEQEYNKLIFEGLENGEKINDFSGGSYHLLLLTNKGKLFINNTSGDPINKGQYGLPKLSPLTEDLKIPVNQPIELNNLNNEIVLSKDGTKSLKDRRFNQISSGKYHNIVSDLQGNIWTWGSNIFGECAGDISYNTDIQPIPKKILTIDDFSNLTKHLLKNDKNEFSWGIKKLSTNDETSFIQLRYIDHENESNTQDILMSFGNGIKGQLGNSRYLHVCPQPQIIKSLMNMNEYNEKLNITTNIGIKDISSGSNHSFITLDNYGDYKDVLTFGDNEFGQFGNGKKVKNCKPIQIPKLLEPNDIGDNFNDKKQRKKLVRKMNDIITRRLQLSDGITLANGDLVEQIIVAGEDSSAIYYKRK